MAICLSLTKFRKSSTCRRFTLGNINIVQKRASTPFLGFCACISSFSFSYFSYNIQVHVLDALNHVHRSELPLQLRTRVSAILSTMRGKSQSKCWRSRRKVPAYGPQNRATEQNVPYSTVSAPRARLGLLPMSARAQPLQTMRPKLRLSTM